MATSGLDLTGRVAVVTGAGSPTGIGFAVCRRLGELGATIALTATTDRVDERGHDLQEADVPAMGGVADLTDPAAAGGVGGTVRRRWGPPGRTPASPPWVWSQTSPILPRPRGWSTRSAVGGALRTSW